MMNRLLAAAALTLTAALVCAQTLQYRDAHGTIGSTIITVDESGAIVITEDEDTILCSPDWSTRSVHHSDPGSSSVADFVRTGDTVRVTGTLRGKVYDKTTAIDGSPWYMDPIAQMRLLTAPGVRKQEFWVISVEDYKMHKLTATFKAEEEFVTPAGTFRARRFLLTVSGLPALVWNADVWIRVSDGVCLCWNHEYTLYSESP